MTITDHIQENYFGGQITYRLFQPIIPSKNYVLFLHGMGEVGPLDGSELYETEKWGWPGFAKGQSPHENQVMGSVEYPFNIVAIQVPSSYGNYLKGIIAWLYYRFQAENIVLAGISLGCIAAYDMLRWDTSNRVLGVVACCGNDSLSSVPLLPKFKGIAWHGDKDTTVGYASHYNFVQAYNAHHGPEGYIEWNKLEGVGHAAWNYAFKADPSQDKSLAFVNALFASKTVADPIAEIKVKLHQFADTL